MIPPDAHCFQAIPSSCLLVTDSLSQGSCDMFHTVIFIPSTLSRSRIPRPIPPYVIIAVSPCERRETRGHATRSVCPSSLGAHNRHQKQSRHVPTSSLGTSGGGKGATIHSCFPLQVLRPRNVDFCTCHMRTYF